MKTILSTTALIAGLLLSGAALAGGSHSNANSGSVSGSLSSNDGNQQAITIEGSTTYQGDIPRQAPGIVAPSLTTTMTETCMGSTSMGFSGAGFGVTFGSTWRDEACVRRLDARELRSFGAGLPAEDAILFHFAAKERMCEDGKVRAAFERVAKMTGRGDALCQATADEREEAAANRAANETLGYVETHNTEIEVAERTISQDEKNRAAWARTMGGDR